MINETELKQQNFSCVEFKPEMTSYKVSAGEMKQFKDRKVDLSKKIGDYRIQYRKDNNISAEESYDKFYEKCRINPDTLRKTINGTTKATRNLLYKLAVGMKMSMDEANSFFALCDGELDPERCEMDYICIKALEDGDSIDDFIEQAKEFAGVILEKKERAENKKRG